MPIILTQKTIQEPDVKLLGGKGIHLAEMVKEGFPVPETFFITTEAYDKFVEMNDLKPKIMEIVNNADFSSIDSLTDASERVKKLFLDTHIPAMLREPIMKTYKDMGYDEAIKAIEFVNAARDIPFVAVRSSGVLEDAAGASAAGQYETFLNVRGKDDLFDKVKRCWASLYTPRVMYYRHKNNQPQDTTLCVVIQRMVNSESSGVSFTVDPTDPVGGANHIINEAVWGLGEMLVQGRVDPDHYVVDKSTGEILSKKISSKKEMMVKDRNTGKTIILPVPAEYIDKQILTDEQIVALSSYCKKIEQFYQGKPQDIEWATERGKIYITQSRAVTTLEKKEVGELGEVGRELIRGVGASPGIATGPVKLIKDLNELGRIEYGDVLVTTMTSPDYVPAMEKSVAIVTNRGGSTCHAAIVSRELGIPCIVGTQNATEIIKEGMIVTVDAVNGVVYEGKVAVDVPEVKHEEVSEEIQDTATDVKVNLAFPDTADKISGRADGVGLLRLEHMMTKAGMHPFEYVRQGKQDELTDMIVEGVGKVAKSFFPKPVWVRTLDVRTDEYSNMEGGSNEPKEDNPMLGWHGVRRSLEDTDIIKTELRAIKKLHEQGMTNVAVMLPFVYDVSELKKAKEIASEIGLPETVKFGIMIEVPSTALSIEKFCEEGIDFVSFGSNDLTQLTLGVDRNNERLIKLFDEMHPGMQALFKYAIEICKRNGVKTSICGELPSNRYDAVEFLIRTGIDSVSVNIDAVDKVRGWVAKIERKLLIELLKNR
ncbi:MAG: phosphoenolpyruvate synthase [Candidatus Aenigmarchaeota archaeon]|nr:phosphoenolpyruvate synthase [Candidatus Aenigmarchaeota archaeon]